jgi:hypothetical protein
MVCGLKPEVPFGNLSPASLPAGSRTSTAHVVWLSRRSVSRLTGQLLPEELAIRRVSLARRLQCSLIVRKLLKEIPEDPP